MWGNPLALTPVLQTASDDASYVANQFYMALRENDHETNLPAPALAEKLEVSANNQDYIYTLNQNAKWSDGTPVTTEDVEFSFQTLMNPKTNSAVLRNWFRDFTFQKLDRFRFKFHVENPRYNTLEVLDNYFRPIQKKQFVNEPDFNSSKEHFHPIGNGPFRIKTFSRDVVLVLERIPNWWAKDLPRYRALYNFDTWTYKIMSDPTLIYEKFIKGEFDSTDFTTRQYALLVNKQYADLIGKSPKDGKKLWAKEFPIESTSGWVGIVLNNRSPLFQSVNTRKGLAYLVDYQKMSDMFYFGFWSQLVSPFGSRTKNTDPSLQERKRMYRFDPKVAQKLFEKDGWRKDPGDLFLAKRVGDQKIPFHFVLRYIQLT